MTDRRVFIYICNTNVAECVASIISEDQDRRTMMRLVGCYPKVVSLKHLVLSAYFLRELNNSNYYSKAYFYFNIT